MEEADKRREEEAGEWRQQEANGWRELYSAFYTLSLRFRFDYDVQTLITLKN